MDKTVTPSKISGSIEIPGSKSHMIRALIIASLADGKSIIERPLFSSDTLSCIDACRQLGANIKVEEKRVIIRGVAGRIKYDKRVIDVGNSGTTLYLVAAIASLSDENIRFTGDKQIQQRSADKLLNSLEELNVKISSNKGCAPFSICGPITGGETSIECPTSQYLSALLLTLPLATNESIINVPLLNEKPYIELTLQWLKEQNIKLKNSAFKKFTISGNQKYSPFVKQIPADFSSASFFLAAAAITGSTLTVKGIDMKDSQGDKEIVFLLEKMGCYITIMERSVTIRGGELKGIDIDLNAMPDSLPILAIVGACAKGKTRLYNVAHARQKETDRVAVMSKQLGKLGIKTTEHEDGLTIEGGIIEGGRIDGHHDHRIVMAFAVAALIAKNPISISGAQASDVTFPGFFNLLESIKI